ncbi:protein broad-minded isoform X2 [Chiloscyllium plagiosum]|uniref:protein broad-minded isoform X1 n=1 Tax=Chiloscyllium plagiosum TaxID=36176 RepID=UPI001CB84564|nr:protein broad-minded isoform X1 [Chiloscyllium plagiosum]XP_043540242.1 protein broad-minded isoform X2 [Chiloscyllium plagiosum]
MSHLPNKVEAELQPLLGQLLKSIKERISGAPSVECAEEILLHLEETDENFHNYELVKYLRNYIDTALGSVIEEETEKCTSAEGRSLGSGQDTLVQQVTRKTRESEEYKEMMRSLKNTMMVVVESLINKFEEDKLKKEELHKKKMHEQHTSYCMDSCSDSGSSFNQSYTFMNQEQLQIIVGKLDPSQPKEIRREALQSLCCAPPSDVLNCECWITLRKHLVTALSDPDPILSDRSLRFYAKTFSSSTFSATRETYTSLAMHLESCFTSQQSSVPTLSAGMDITNPDVVRLLKKFRLLNEFQKEVPSFWIRHPEKFMEEIVESTLSLLSVTHEQSFRAESSHRVLKPVYFLALLDTKASWFNKWMHGYYSRTVVLRLLENKYKSLITAAVRQCLDYYDSKNVEDDDTDNLCTMRYHRTNGRRTYYTGHELQYIYFVHSLCLLGRLLMYTDGRKLFPIKVKNRKEPVALMDLLVLLIQMMHQNQKSAQNANTTQRDSFAPANFVMEVLRMLCGRKECATECLYRNVIIDSLLFPISTWLKDDQMLVTCVETVLINTADILARIASTDRGLSLLLFGENNKHAASNCPSAAQLIAEFTKRLLDGELPPLASTEPSTALKGAFIFVCRQMYNTCEGLDVLMPYGLHESISKAWKKACSLSERTPTPVAGNESGATAQELQNTMVLEEMLLDNLLNFAATPKGLLLLQQTGALNECVVYMFSRYTKKLQVSKCEKFGYGVMVTQVAATAPGIVALQSSGFIKALVMELWSVLECGRDDARMINPKPTPVEPIDRSCQKSFLALVNLLSSFYAVYELIGNMPLPNKSAYSLREVPTSIVDLIDRLIIMNSNAKIHSLFNYEHSHMFGVRLLSVMCCNLDILLLLESQYHVSEILLNAQKENVRESLENPGDFIIDGLSVERNQILVRMNLIGGPSERVLPPRVLQKGNDPFRWPLFSSYPLPKCYLREPLKKPSVKQDNELSKLLKNLEMQTDWLESCKKQFCRIMKSKPDILKGSILAELLEKFVGHFTDNPSDCFFRPYEVSESGVKRLSLSPIQHLGIKIVVRYGKFLGLLKDDSDQELANLLKHCERFVKQQQITISSSLHCLQGDYVGHDWFASTAFLIMSGDGERTLRFLQQFSSLLVSAFLWLPRLHASIHLSVQNAESGIHPVYSCTAYYIEMLLKIEVPLVFSAFRMSGFTPSQICQHWLSQCFWNYLNWTEIGHYIAVCVILGPDYQVYMCIALLKHLEQEILHHMQTQDLQVFLKEEAIHGFQVSSYLDFMENLEHSYRTTILTEMENIKS